MLIQKPLKKTHIRMKLGWVTLTDTLLSSSTYIVCYNWWSGHKKAWMKKKKRCSYTYPARSPKASITAKVVIVCDLSEGGDYFYA